MAKAPGEVLAGESLQRESLGAVFVLKDPSDPLDPATISGPSLIDSSQLVKFHVVSDSTLLTVAVTLIVRNPRSAQPLQVLFSFATPTDLSRGVDLPIVFNTSDVNNVVTPLVCGTTESITIQALIGQPPGVPDVFSNIINSVIDREPCFTSQIRDFSSSVKLLAGSCLGVQGTIVAAGKLVECGFTLGVGVCIDLPGAPVQVGLMDPATNTFYLYETVTTGAAGTPAAGSFQAGFEVSNRADVVGLVPVNGSKRFNLVAFYAGDIGHTAVFSDAIPVNVQGEQAAPCPLGTLLVHRDIQPVPSGVTEIHELTATFTGTGLSFLGGLISSAQQEAIIAAAKSAVESKGGHPIFVEVYQGPTVDLGPFALIFPVLSLGPVPILSVRVHAFGSPVAALVLILAIVAALVLLGIVVFFILRAARDLILSGPAGGAALVLLAVAGVGVVAGGLYLLTRPRTRRLLQ